MVETYIYSDSRALSFEIRLGEVNEDRCAACFAKTMGLVLASKEVRTHVIGSRLEDDVFF
jgi:hypothetical protein